MRNTVQVLHVDDEPSLTELAADFLEREDDRIEMLSETNVGDALQRLEENHIDCIVSDYDMPGKNGIEFLEAVREHYPALPFILFTGKGSEEVASEAISAGVTEYLQKESGTGQYEVLANRITNAVGRHHTEKDLNETDQALQTILDNRPVVLYTTDKEGTITRAKGKALEQVGLGSTDAVGKSVFEVFEDRSEIIDHFERALDGESVEDISEVRDTIFQSWYQPLRDDNGDITGGLGLSIDISERERRKRRVEWQTDVLEAAPVGVLMTDPTQEDNPIVFANEQFKTLTGYEMDELLGRNCRFLQGDETDPEAVARLREAIDAKEPVTIELRNYRKDGTLFWNEVSIGHTQLEEEGEERYIGFQRDVTERKARERAVSDAEKRYRTFVEAAPDAVLVADAATGELIEANSAAETLFDRPEESIVGSRLWEFHSPEAKTRYRELFEGNEVKNLPAAQLEGVSDAEVVTPEGERVPVEINAETVELGDRTLLQGIFRDATERKESEREIEAQNATMAALHTVTSDLVSCRSVDEVCELTVDAAEEILDFDLCYIGIVEGESIVPRARSTDAGPEHARTMGVDEGMAGKTHRTGTSYLTEDIPAADDAEPVQPEYRSAISVPIGERGVFQAVSMEVEWFDETDLELAETLLTTVRATIERVEREEQLREHEVELQHERNSLAALFENVPDPIYRHSRDGDAVVPEAVNPAFERVFGYDEATVVGRPITETIVPPDRIEEHERLAAASNAGESLKAEVERCAADGRRTFRLRNAPIEGPTGDRSEEYAIYTDITERREAESFRRRLYELTADTEATTDETIARMLELGCEYFGMESTYLTDIKDDTQRIVRANSPHKAIQAGSECPLPETYCRKTMKMDEPMTVTHAGASGWEDDPAYERFGLEAYVGARLTIEGERYGTVCFADRTPRETEFSELDRSFVDLLARGIESTLERHRYETELERQNDQLGEFASVISHDLRNPLTVADGYLELASETGDDEHFTKVADAHDRMDAIIKDVLTLTRQGERIAETTSVNLVAVAEDAWANVATADAELVKADNLGEIDADEGRLTQLFENLYRNAVEHAGEDVTILVGRSPTGFYVEDDGPGIAESERETVFDSGYTTGEEGTGMGLSIVETIATAHGWGIGVTDGAEDGARFEIQLGVTRGGSDDLLLSG